MQLSDLRDKRVVVWGFGREGKAALAALSELKLKSLDVVDDAVNTLSDLSLDGRQIRSAADSSQVLANADVIVKSPGLSKYDERLVSLQRAGVSITGGTALWMASNHGTTIGVTGSKGKSTTSTLIHFLLERLGVVSTLGGNIGTPLLSLAAGNRYVVELSSYQCAELCNSPEIAVVTSLFPDHLNWHGSEQQYYSDKLNIAKHSPRVVIFNGTDARLVSELGKVPVAGKRVSVGGEHGFHAVMGNTGVSAIARQGEVICTSSILNLRGVHNAVNVCLALAAIEESGIDVLGRRDEVAAVLHEFQPLPHRLNVINDPSGLVFVDDSLSTAPEAAIAALAAFPVGPVCLIVGGFDRGLDYSPLKIALSSLTRRVVIIGLPESGRRIVSLVRGIGGIECHLADNLDAAVSLARSQLVGGGTVLLSPAAPSYGVYRNYEDRSQAFIAAVEASAG